MTKDANVIEPHMSDAERALFQAFLAGSSDYLEFGAGGSTVMAARTVRNCVRSVDTSAAWIARVEEACRGFDSEPRMTFVDLGTVGYWGFPLEEARRDTWPAYHTTIWEDDGAAASDLFMVDGRFRVACAMQILLRCRSDALIMVHDFASRAHYQVIRSVAREVARAEDLSVFVRPASADRARIEAVLEAHRIDPT